jgi:four helix bundle protein
VTFLFEKLDVYQRALAFADQASALTVRFPRQFWHLADQFNRASLSIALNVAEGNGRGTPLDKRRFLVIARGSTFECVALAEMCNRKHLLPEGTLAQLRDVLTSLSKVLSALVARTSTPAAVREEVADYI